MSNSKQPAEQTPPPSATALEAYGMRYEDAITKVDRLKVLIECHKGVWEAEGINWEHVGDLAHVIETLETGLAFMGDTPVEDQPDDVPAEDLLVGTCKWCGLDTTATAEKGVGTNIDCPHCTQKECVELHEVAGGST